MHSVVLDTNVLVSALWSVDGNPYRIVEKVFLGEIVPFVNAEVIAEYHEVLFRAKLGFPRGKVNTLLSEVMQRGVFTESSVSSVAFIDESDRKFYDLAKTSEVLLITGNIRHFPTESFILTPAGYLSLFA